ncbi:MAG: carboxyl transferase [Lachnospiraceae bacterium]|nr:carboxyl transferase [Lachnospiraceae bacterium]
MLDSAREKIEALLDDHSFVEIGAEITSRKTDFNITANGTPSDGVITGHGLIDGGVVFIYAQDADVLGGSMGEMHIQKIIRLYDMAMRLGAPVVGLLNSTGIRFQESFDATESMAALYRKSTEASGMVPQIIGIFGQCGGALSVFASLNDFIYMTDSSTMFLQSPKALTDTDEDTSTAQYQYQVAGNVDGVGSELEVIWAMRNLLSTIPGSNREHGLVTGCSDDLNRGVLDLENKRDNIADFCRELSDETLYIPVRDGVHKSMACGFIRMGGVTVGVIGNQSEEEGKAPVLTAGGARKAAGFVRFCDAFDIPILSLINVSGYKPTKEAECGLPRAMAGLTAAFAKATVPKVGLYLKETKGSAYLAMDPKSLGADLVYAYPDASMEVIDAKLAAQILTADLPGDRRMIAKDFAEKHSGVQNAARHGYVNRIINFVDTRKYLIDAFGILFTKDLNLKKKHGCR